MTLPSAESDALIFLHSYCRRGMWEGDAGGGCGRWPVRRLPDPGRRCPRAALGGPNMATAACRRTPEAPALWARSEPARSTMFNLATQNRRPYCPSPSAAVAAGEEVQSWLCSMTRMKTACERELASFALVAAVLRALDPLSRGGHYLSQGAHRQNAGRAGWPPGLAAGFTCAAAPPPRCSNARPTQTAR